MKLQCPSCLAEMDLDVLLAHEEGRHTLAKLIAAGTPIGAWTLRYLALFRPAKRALSMSRTLKLLAEIWPDIERGRIERKGREWDAPRANWQAAIEQLLATRDRGNLNLPLTSHGYLYEILVGMADKAEAQSERDTEAERRSARGPAIAMPAPPAPAHQPQAARTPVPENIRAAMAGSIKKLKGITS